MTKDPYQDQLTEEEFRILRQKGTEAPFTGEYFDHNERGVYACKACGAELFSSENKFNAHCGWPNFDDVIRNENIKTSLDERFGMLRTEVSCANCGSHLGHVFPDGPQETTGQRYCINSIALKFKSH